MNILLILITILTVCSRGRSKSDENFKSDVSLKNEVNFKNILKVTKDHWKKWNLPFPFFSISYPDRVELTFPGGEKQNVNYISFYKKNSKQAEELVINYLIGEITPEIAIDFLEPFEEEYKSFASSCTKCFIGQKKFHGKEAFQLQMEYETTSMEHGDSGTWKELIVILPNDKHKNENGLLITIKATKNHDEIKNFDDLGLKGVTGKIWQTFQFE